MPVWLIPVLYGGLGIWLIYRHPFFKTTVGTTVIAGAFVLKCLAGMINYAIWMYHIGHGDSLNYIHDATLIYSTLFEHPSHFLQLTFGWGPTNEYPQHLLYISEPLKYSWNNLEYNMVRLNTLLFLFTWGNAWGNIVLLNIFYLLGGIWLFKQLVHLQPNRKIGWFAMLFLFPSTLIYGSGFLKEGPVLLFIQCVIAILIQQTGQHQWRGYLKLIPVMLGLWLFRDYMVLLLIPALLLYWLAETRHITAWKVYAMAGLAGLVLVLIADARSYSFTVSEIICEAQQFFIEHGEDPDYSYYIFSGVDLWEPWQQLPRVLVNIFLRPNVWQSSDPIRLFHSLELQLVWLTWIWLLFRNIKSKHIPSLTWFLTLMAMLLLLIYGFVVTDADSMSRYRSIPLFLLLLAWFLPINTKQFKHKNI